MLRGVALAGAASAGAAAGVGTQALLSDGERFEGNSLTSGSLDLQVAAETTVDGDTKYAPKQDGRFPSTFADESGVSVEFPDLGSAAGGPPESKRNGTGNDQRSASRAESVSGTAKIALRVCDNPGRVWLRIPNSGRSTLAEHLDVELSYASDWASASTTVHDGSLSGLLDRFQDGTLLGSGCREIGKVEVKSDGSKFETESDPSTSLSVTDVPGTLSLDGPDGPVDIEVTDLHWKDEGESDAEVRGVDLASDDVEFCRVDVKGGGSPDVGTKTYYPSCDSTATGLLTGDNPGGQPSGLSNFVVYGCGDEADCVDCDSPARLTLDWTLSDSARFAGESLSLDLELQASQCRHTDPENPWT